MSATAPLRMPKLGLTMTEGVLASWAVAIGDAVKTGDVLFTVETDKIATDVEAQDDGTIVTLDADEGGTYAVGAVLGTWTGRGFDMDLGVAGAEPAPAAPVDTVPPNEASVIAARHVPRLIATPLARRVARDNAVDLAGVKGGSINGRIKMRDVHAVIAGRTSTGAAGETTTRTPASPLRRIVAQRMTEAKQTIPHFYLMTNADLGMVTRLREELNADCGAHARLSVTHVLVAALARAISAMPDANEIWDDDALVRFATTDIGVAVAGPRGLVAPLVRDLGNRPLDDIAARTDAVVTRARANALTPDDLKGGAISLSNVGMFGATALVPIVNPGQSAILGVGAAEDVFRPDGQGRPVLAQELRLTLSCDHRVWDGARAARFLDLVRGHIARPLTLFRA